MRKAILAALLLGILFLVCVYLYLHKDRSRSYHGTETVFIEKSNEGTKLYRNGAPFYIKGASGSSYLEELTEAGGNTLRVYDTINLQTILDEAEQFNIALVVDIPIPVYNANDNFYKAKDKTDKLKRDIKKFVRIHKNHPALLIWNLGNEINYPLSITENDFIKTFNELIDLIHEEDPDHLISTSITSTSRGQTLGIHLNSPKIDLIGFNIFGNISEVEPLMKKVSYITNPKPYYITEWGIHGPWEVPFSLWWAPMEIANDDKGKEYKERYQTYIKNNTDCLGSLVFYWGYKHEGTISWFNIFDENGRKSQSYYDLKAAWTGKENKTKIIKVDKMRLNDSLTNHLVVLPGSILNAEFETDRTLDSVYKVYWSLYKEGWGYQHWREESDSTIFFQDMHLSPRNRLKIKVPNEEGPFRLFVSVYDGKGNFSTINRPFYILSKE